MMVNDGYFLLELGKLLGNAKALSSQHIIKMFVGVMVLIVTS